MPQQFAYFPLGGGLDLVTPAIAQKPGSAIGALNYEPASNGYRRVDGHERFDGHTSPTDAPYYELDFTGAVSLFAAGDLITGANSGATGVALADSVVTSGTYASGDAAGYVGIGLVVGNFIDGEPLQVGSATLSTEDGGDLLLESGATFDLEPILVSIGPFSMEDGTTALVMEDGATTLDLEGFVSAVVKARANGTQKLFISPDDATTRAWQAAATTNARALIQKVPGSGSVLGVNEFNGSIYAFRNNALGTAAAMWKATAAGWASVALGYTLDFTAGGAYVINEGDVITGATSGNTATVARVVTQSGSWSAGTAAGYLVIASASGAFVAENLNVGANLNVATIAADKVAITLPPGGRYEFVNHNFYGASRSVRMYGVNGVGPAFEFDGATFTTIRSGMAVDTPKWIAAHKEHLWFAFPGGAFQNSSIGEPLNWSAVTGAAAYGMGDEITGFVSSTVGVLTVLAVNKIATLYGSSTADFQLVDLSDEAGAMPYTVDKVGEAIYMDARGVRQISTTQNYGDFQLGTLSQNIKPLLQDYARSEVTPVASARVRTKDLYKIFFSNGQGLSFYFGKNQAPANSYYSASPQQQQPSVLPFDLGKVVTCIGSFEMATGERVFFGSTDGYVYEADKGYSFDGDPIPFSLRLPFNHERAPQTLKRWHKVTVECQAIPTATIQVAADFDYGDPFEVGSTPQSVAAQVFTVTGGGGVWDISNWNQFYWSGATEGLMEAHLDGVGRNMSLLIAGSTADEPPHLLQGLTLFFTVRGLQR